MGQEVATPHETLNTLFADRVRRDRTRTALRRKAPSGAYEDVSWGTYGTFATSFGLGLMKLGLLPGDRAAILSNSCLEWLYADMAIIGGGAVSVPIYQNAREEEVAHIVADSRSRVIFLEDAGQLAKLVKAVGLRTLETLEAAIVFQPISDTQRASVEGLRVLTLDELGALDRNGDVQSFDSRGSQVVPDDLATIIYTSGTTGVPKGVMLSHRNCCLQARATNAVFGLNGDDVVLSFLPLAHLIARTPSWRAMLTGCVTVYAPLATALDEMKEARPTAMLCPPRIYEKIHAALQQKVESRSLLERRYLKASVVWAERADERRREHRAMGVANRLQHLVATPAIRIFSRWFREMTGGQLRFLYSAGAPLSKHVAASLHALGIVVIEGYGLTEAAGGVHANRPDHYKLGTVGSVIPPTESKLAGDGEILIRGPTVMMGYYNLPKETEATISSEGWLHTGDVGEIDSDGFLKITDRKKDLIKTSGGKFVAPQKIENLMKTIRGVSQVAVFGDGHKYCVALVTIDPEAAAHILREAGQPPVSGLPALARDVTIHRVIAQGIAEKNALLASFETIKDFRVVPEEFSNELTSTLKLMRRRVAEKHGSLIDEMFARPE